MSVTVPLGDLRPIIGKRVDAAHFADEATIITKNGQPHAAIVSYETYRSLTEEDPNDSPLIHHK
jgi:prevent-host-death family protein